MGRDRAMKRLTAQQIAAAALMTALLIGGQVALGMVAGIEIVTVLLLCYAYAFGPVMGMLTAVAFSLLRCFVWGFYPSVIVLYLIYYTLFALLFGLLGNFERWRQRKAAMAAAEGEASGKVGQAPAGGQPPAEAGRTGRERGGKLLVLFTELLFVAVAVPCAGMLGGYIRISSLALSRMQTLSWIILGIDTAGFLAYNFLLLVLGHRRAAGNVRYVISMTVIAAFCTVCFSLLDDVITPLFYGYAADAALAYFYTSFLAMIPQTLCTIVTVSLFFEPLTKIFGYAAKHTAK